MSEMNQVQYHAIGETVAIYVYVNGEKQRFVKESILAAQIIKATEGMDRYTADGGKFSEGEFLYRSDVLTLLKQVGYE